MQMGGGLFWGGVGGGGEPVVGTELISEDLAFLGLIQELGNFRLAGDSPGVVIEAKSLAWRILHHLQGLSLLENSKKPHR